MIRFFAAGLFVLIILAQAAHATPIRIKDLVEFDGVRGNDLVGYGLVVGLNGTGDGLRNAPFTEEIMVNILERLGVNVTGEQFRPENVAAVIVTAVLPPFARQGGQIDVTVSAIGDADSLLGGTLVMTPLTAADGEIYAVHKDRSSQAASRPRGMGPISSSACRQRVPSHRVHGSSARWNSLSIPLAKCVWRCVAPISPPPRGSKARSMPISANALPRCSMRGPLLSISLRRARARPRMR